MEPSDSEIANKILAGQKELFGLLIDRHQDKLYDLALRMTGNGHEAEDIVQQAFIKMYENLAGYKDIFKFSNWAYTITLNTTRNHLRRRALLKFFSLDSRAENSEHENMCAQEPAGDIPENGTAMEAGELAAELEAAVERLPARLKDVFILHYFHRNSVQDTARAAGISENAASARLFRARRILYDGLSGRFPEITRQALKEES